MPHPARRKLADKVLIEFVEADVDIGFGLVDEARTYRASGQHEFSRRALQNAADKVAEIEHRLEQLGQAESEPFHPLLAELRYEIEAVERETS